VKSQERDKQYVKIQLMKTTHRQDISTRPKSWKAEVERNGKLQVNPLFWKDVCERWSTSEPSRTQRLEVKKELVQSVDRPFLSRTL
jgi:hypothetical protein